MASYGLTLVTAPAIEPVTLEEARYQVGVPAGVDYHDTNLTRLITAAREKVETDTGRAIITQTWEMAIDLLPFGINALYLPRSPVQSVTYIKYYDTTNTQQTLSTATYKTLLDREPGEIRLHWQQIWPLLYWEPGVVTVRFVAGYGDTAANVPQSLKQALLLLIGWWFEDPTAMQTNNRTDAAYKALISRHTVGDEFHVYGRTPYRYSNTIPRMY